MEDKIGDTAGAVWRYLKKNGETAMARIPKAVGTPDQLAFQAIGWLARERKIKYRIKGRQTMVDLAE